VGDRGGRRRKEARKGRSKTERENKRKTDHCSVVALCYKVEGRGFEIQSGAFLNLPNPSGRIKPWGSETEK
jgi:hypothetical protein